jgi:hypothetical protein
VTVQTPPVLGPLVDSASANEFEAELKQMFIDLFANYLRSTERDLNVYGVAQLGSLDLLQQSVTRDGLAAFPNDINALGYLYRTWHARNPKRGMAFLKTYLQLMWPNGWTVQQMWQDKSKPYPTALVAVDAISGDPHATHFLTSRIVVAVDDANETGVNVERVSPAIRSVLAARFLLEIQTLRRFANTGANAIGIGSACYIEQLASFTGTVVPAGTMITLDGDLMNTFTGDTMTVMGS